MFGGDENCRPGYDDPRQALETCGFVEQMLSDEMLMRITGDPFWADHCEDVAFNSYPAAVMPDFNSLRYLTAPNMVVSDQKNHSPGIDNRAVSDDESLQFPLLPAQSFPWLAVLQQEPLDGHAGQWALRRALRRQRCHAPKSATERR